ncbi:hypothetical protein P9852_15565, partial [Geobacillus stearothermophilus]|uniref:hypothetical protein n=1 Tax=Geobacillus stearothermophilus TaxID=1422 RepID=UPI002E1FA3CC|nr:hypothetical protein [Geobacillus stearothermophilus]
RLVAAAVCVVLLRSSLCCSIGDDIGIRHIWRKEGKEGWQMDDLMTRLLAVAGVAVCVGLLFLVGANG